MKTLLVLGPDPSLAAAIRVVVDADRYRVLAQTDLAEAGAMVRQGSVDACVLDADLTDIQPIRTIEQLRRMDGRCPILVFSGRSLREWEEEACLQGVERVFSKPIRAALLNTVLDRLWQRQGTDTALFLNGPTSPGAPLTAPAARPPAASLDAVREVSATLKHSLSTADLSRHYLQLLREVLAVNRIALFLRQPPGDFRAESAARRLPLACALGLPPGRTDHFELSLDSGIGGFAQDHGRILTVTSDAARADRAIQKEFDLLGGQVAVPILDRTSLVGVVVLDGRVTGEPFTSAELAQLFHVLEELGLAFHNAEQHRQSLASGEMMADVLDQSGSGFLVVTRERDILHVNEAARTMLGLKPGPAPLRFADLPQALGSRIFSALESGAAIPAFRQEPRAPGSPICRIAIAPFRPANTVTTGAVLVKVEDITERETAQRLEIEASNLRLVKVMAEHLAHEIGNSLVPLSTHQQLLARKFDDPEFRTSLSGAMADAVQRISRLSNQMLYLARDSVVRSESVPVQKLVEDAFQEAQRFFAPKPANLLYETNTPLLAVNGDKAGLRQALSEVLLNALQANPPNAPVQVRSATETDASGDQWVHIEVRDSGPGFTPEALLQASRPFFSTRNVGLGLGLAVTRKVVETHRGQLAIPSASGSAAGVVRVTLPAVKA